MKLDTPKSDLPALTFATPPHILVIEARFYNDVVDGLAAGAHAVLAHYGATHDTVVVPGALETPAAIAMVHAAGQGVWGRPYDGYVVLGCVIRGATSHYDTVANESARGIMDLSVRHGLAVGNGILTCETKAQADERADPAQMDKGGGAALAALTMVALRHKLQK